MSKLWPIDVAGGSAIVVTAALTWLIGIQPALKNNSEARRLTADATARSETIDDLQRVQARLDRGLASLQDTLARDALTLEPVSMLNERLARLATLASDCGLEISGLQPGETSADPRFTIVPISVHGEGAPGSYAAVARFLGQMHSELRDTSIESFRLNSASPGGALDLQLEIVWYARPTSVADGGV